MGISYLLNDKNEIDVINTALNGTPVTFQIATSNASFLLILKYMAQKLLLKLVWHTIPTHTCYNARYNSNLILPKLTLYSYYQYYRFEIENKLRPSIEPNISRVLNTYQNSRKLFVTRI